MDIIQIVETPEQITKHYSAAMDSVNLITELKAKSVLTSEETQRLAANVEHLQLVLTKTYWTTENLTPFKTAII